MSSEVKSGIHQIISAMPQIIFNPRRDGKKSYTERTGDFFLSIVRSAGGVDSNKPPRTRLRDLAGKIILLASTAPLAVVGIGLKALSFSTDPTYQIYCNPTPMIAAALNHPVIPTSDGNLVSNLKLLECSCSFWNRASPDNPRSKIISDIVTSIRIQEPNIHAPIRLGSLGAGGLATEFEIIARLAIEGYKNISFDCIDPKISNENPAEKITQFFGDTNVNVSIKTYRNIREVPTGTWHHLIAIDYAPIIQYNSFKSSSFFYLFPQCSSLHDWIIANRKAKDSTLTYLSDILKKRSNEVTISSRSKVSNIEKGDERCPYYQRLNTLCTTLSDYISHANTSLIIQIPAVTGHSSCFYQPGEIILALSLVLERQKPSLSSISLELLGPQNESILETDLITNENLINSILPDGYRLKINCTEFPSSSGLLINKN